MPTRIVTRPLRTPPGAVAVFEGPWANPYYCQSDSAAGRYATADALRTYLRARRTEPPGWSDPDLDYPSDEQIRAELGGRDLACTCAEDEPCHGLVLLEAANPRPNTPDEKHPEGGTRITMKRCCNGCGERIGDVTDWEMLLAVHYAAPLPDVRDECPTCTPTLAELTR
ncbi:DUF4326 domain-containing protein [Streptomyces sp. NPDC046977]|uniref:DUF4326 domain-containing protein n=1 Tax=Streptomyces sp. NPDC046977 TaxID=3154703 RepID=UPI003400FDE8